MRGVSVQSNWKKAHRCYVMRTPLLRGRIFLRLILDESGHQDWANVLCKCYRTHAPSNVPLILHERYGPYLINGSLGDSTPETGSRSGIRFCTV